MNRRWSRLAMAALALPVAIPAVVAIAQTQGTPPSPPSSRMEGRMEGRAEARSPEVRARLFDGRMAMVKESLKLDERQLQLWAPVEAELRASFDARQKARTEREARRRSGERISPALPDRLDRASHRAAERAERLKALSLTFRPFYAALSDEQKAVADAVLRPAWRNHGLGGRRHLRRASTSQEL